MDFFSGLLMFFLIWWVVIFCVLPWGIRTDIQSGAGAPVNPQLKKKFLVTTGISVLVWVLVFGLIQADIIDYRAISRQMVQEDTK
jgi:predicted secreted protein